MWKNVFLLLLVTTTGCLSQDSSRSAIKDSIVDHSLTRIPTHRTRPQPVPPRPTSLSVPEVTAARAVGNLANTGRGALSQNGEESATPPTPPLGVHFRVQPHPFLLPPQPAEKEITREASQKFLALGFRGIQSQASKQVLLRQSFRVEKIAKQGVPHLAPAKQTGPGQR